MKIQALHKFHNTDFSRDWTEKFKPTQHRIRLFETILKQIEDDDSKQVPVLELGIGPGFLASYLLNRLPQITYEGLDFSKSMLGIAKKRTEVYNDRIDFIQADLINEAWNKKIKMAPKVIVSTWALHDLFEKKNILNVYRTAYEILPVGGLLLNGDFIKPEESDYEYEGGRIKPSEHLKLLRIAGFRDPWCIEEFEKSVDNPTTSNNYACFKAKK
ncbi:class I SAM-dependent methyltransferase [Eudoraea chungangensis]|uniref:class I SAM-dependent methyltransferase n=1 Tax=Eudoraea chungangensis TaxID=1481905 RepID=UPI0023EB240F|nr:class I SAM-dependent methyltransferase [Eudoraea chungangensis]